MNPLVFNIVDYGANQDDPAANHLALNTACELASSWGGEVFVPAGEWQVDGLPGALGAWAVLGNNYRIRGVRGQSWIKLKGEQPSAPCVTVLVDGNRGIEFCDIGFDGNWGNGRTSVAMSMVGLSLPQGTIEVAEGTDNFPTPETTPGTFWIVLADGDAQEITYTGKTVGSFTGCTGGSGIIQRGALIGRQDSLDGINHGAQADPKSHGVMLRSAVDVRFEHCIWRQCYGDGVWIGASDTKLYASKDVTFADCRMDVCARNGISLAGICSEIKIDCTRFENIFVQAVDCEPVETWVRDVTVRDSFLGGWWNPGNSNRSINAPLSIAGGKDTIQWRETAARQFRILNCQLQGAAVLSGCANVVIRDCSFVSAWDGGGDPLVYIIGHVDDVWIVDNHLYSRVTPVPGRPDAVIVARHNGYEHRNVQPTGVHIKGNQIHGRNGRNGIWITGPGGGAVNLDGDVRTSLGDESGIAESIDFSTTVAAGSNGHSLVEWPTTINVNVASTAGAPEHGTFRLTTTAGDKPGTRVITYTGKNDTQFTGCSGGRGTMTTGDLVAISLLTDNSKLWEVDRLTNFRVLVGNRTGVIRSNTDQQLTLYDTLSDKTFFAVSGWGDPYNGDPVPSPSAGAYEIIAPSRGFVTIEGNDIDLSDDGNGGGGNGIIVHAERAQARVKVINNTIKCAKGPAISILGPAANEAPTQREFKHLEIVDNHAYDDRETPLTTALIEFKDNPSWAKMILRNNSAGVGVTDHTVGLTEGVWLIEDGSPAKWAGYGSPEGVIPAPVGSTYHRRDGSSASTLYVKQSGVGKTGWAPLSASSGSTVPAYIEQLNMVGGRCRFVLQNPCVCDHVRQGLPAR